MMKKFFLEANINSVEYKTQLHITQTFRHKTYIKYLHSCQVKLI